MNYNPNGWDPNQQRYPGGGGGYNPWPENIDPGFSRPHHSHNGHHHHGVMDLSMKPGMHGNYPVANPPYNQGYIPRSWWR
ncbi:hypothetical protein GJ496_009146 [Pomphorhynchus laevis]|nr:hypothetical protein GJ496_009146 [Pomphorhynchus laevis]